MHLPFIPSDVWRQHKQCAKHDEIQNNTTFCTVNHIALTSFEGSGPGPDPAASAGSKQSGGVARVDPV